MLLPLSQSYIAANAVMAGLAILAVGLRLVARRRKNLSLEVDDYTIIVALVRRVATVIWAAF